jgi:hypothetical protein
LIEGKSAGKGTLPTGPNEYLPQGE